MCTMQPPRLLLFLSLLLPGMWADPEGKWELWLTSTALTAPSEDLTDSSGEAWPGHHPLHGGMTPASKDHAAPQAALSLPTLSVPPSSPGLHAPPAPAQELGHLKGSGVRGSCQAWGLGVPPKVPSSCREPVGAGGGLSSACCWGHFQQPLVRWGAAPARGCSGHRHRSERFTATP